MRHARAMRRLFNAICLQSVVLVGCGAPLESPSQSGSQSLWIADGGPQSAPDPLRLVSRDAAVAPVDAQIVQADAGPAPRMRCCVCQYNNSPGCRTQGSQAACEAVVSAEGTHDCQWVPPPRGGVFGVCKPRHEVDCEDWFADPAQRGWCDRIAYVVDGNDPTGGLQGCTEFRSNREAHGQGCDALSTQVRVCVNRFPSCTNFDISDTGCSTFDNMASANAAMERIRQSLGGQCVTVSANQCTASNSCQSRLIYTIDSTRCVSRADECHHGALCHGHGAVARCTLNGVEGHQACCCANPDAGTMCTWRGGQTCT